MIFKPKMFNRNSKCRCWRKYKCSRCRNFNNVRELDTWYPELLKPEKDELWDEIIKYKSERAW